MTDLDEEEVKRLAQFRVAQWRKYESEVRERPHTPEVKLDAPAPRSSFLQKLIVVLRRWLE